METLSPQEIAKIINVPDPIQTSDWGPGTHPHLLISELVTRSGFVPFRIVNRKTGDVITKLPNEGGTFDATQVDAIYDKCLAMGQTSQGIVLPALIAALPDLDPVKPSNVVELRIGGKDSLADLIDGRLENIRSIPALPTFFENDKGVLSVDLSNALPEHKQILTDAIPADVAVKV